MPARGRTRAGDRRRRPRGRAGPGRVAEQPQRLLLDARRLGHGPAAQAALRRSRPGVRGRPEYGERRKANSSRRPPPSQANRRSPSSARPSGGRPSATRPSSEYGMPRRRTRSRAARGSARRDGTTTAISSAGRPPRRRARISSPTSSSAARVPAASRKRTAPSSGGGRSRRSVEERALQVRERGRVVPALGGSSSIRPRASPASPSAVRASDSNASRPGSYGSDTVTSARPASASSSLHCAPVRSSNP